MPANAKNQKTSPCAQFSVHNKNEMYVAECMRDILNKTPYNELGEKDLQDVYAYALNQLPARYAQSETNDGQDPDDKEEVMTIVQEAFTLVLNHPKT